MPKISFRKSIPGYLFVLPLFIPLLIFNYYPPISGIYHSFFDWNNIGTSTFIGLDNFKELFQDEVFLNSIPTMLKLMIPKLIIGIVVPLIFAEMIFAVRNSRAKYWYRVLTLLPMVAPGVVNLMIWRFIYDPANGIVTTISHLFGGTENIDMRGNPSTVILAVILIGFPWIGGTSVLIYMSGIMSISNEVIEASQLDGCSTLKRIFYIDLPALLGQIKYFLVFGIIGGLQDYGTQMVLTKGGPGYETYVPGYHMYMEAFNSQRMGYACAIGTVMFVVIFVITVATYRFVRTRD